MCPLMCVTAVEQKNFYRVASSHRSCVYCRILSEVDVCALLHLGYQSSDRIGSTKLSPQLALHPDRVQP